jgi:cell division protein FtsB
VHDDLDDPSAKTTRPPRKRRASFAFLAICVAAAGVSSLIGIDIALEHGSFRARDLKVTNKDLTVQENELSAQVEQLQNPAALEKAAHKLGMSFVGQPYYLLVPSGRVIAPEDEEKAPYPVPSGHHSPGEVIVGTPAPKVKPKPTAPTTSKPATGTSSSPSSSTSPSPANSSRNP